MKFIKPEEIPSCYAKNEWEVTEKIGEQWLMLDPFGPKMEEFVTVQSSAGTLILCRLERYHTNSSAGIRLKPVRILEIEVYKP